ncbi:DUF4864 domain-containing protein [uncultured Cohaesibacter sp.]|uniref:DUF4864 domain-containing protein n=1 Tax=uncultured Cohaesibacter sp. TaxID=1002546 RepID=UPI0029C635A4|nr:DUF4864 domain-containing protein [uncultured Cohaesibacter sp.]
MKHVLFGAGICLAAMAVQPAISAENAVPQEPAKIVTAKADKTDADRLQVTDVDRKTIQFVVKLHIASLNQQRADLFSQTFTKKTQEAFESPDHMLAFFSIRYIPVVHAKAFNFDGLSLDGSVPIQHGYLTDSKGNRWRLSYGLQHIGNGDWRIISTIIEHAPGDPT